MSNLEYSLLRQRLCLEILPFGPYHHNQNHILNPRHMPRKEKPLQNSSLEERARQHPDYAKWEAIAAAEEAVNPEDALEHRAVSPEELAYMSAKIYWLRRATEQDVSGFGSIGEHKQRAQAFARQYGLDVADVEKIMEDAEAEVNDMFLRAGDVWKGRRLAEIEIAKLEEKLAEAA